MSRKFGAGARTPVVLASKGHGGTPAVIVPPVTAIGGPMFSGKTTDMLQRFALAHMLGKGPVLVKHTGDDRYAVGEVRTHD